MKLAFDLISDLHVESWDQFDWSGQATSPMCVVAGDVALDPINLKKTLTHLGQNYQLVMYIDGNEEHKHNWDNIGHNTSSIYKMIKKIPNVVYLHDNVVIINGVAFLGTNGWWSWDFDPTIDKDQCCQWFSSSYHTNQIVPYMIEGIAQTEKQYLYNSVSRLQTHPDVKKIVIITHTVPTVKFVEHDLELADSYRINGMGSEMLGILNADTQKKISHWCMGHYHGSIDQTIDQVRYVNNPRGRGDTHWRQTIYYPKRIEVEF